MPGPFYVKADAVLSPGDILAPLPHSRIPKPLKVARKFSGSLPKGSKHQGELREVFEVGKREPKPQFNWDPPGEDILVKVRMSKAVFLTWGSEVEDDERGGDLHRKDWLIVPIFPLKKLDVQTKDSRTGQVIQLAEAICGGKSPRYFPLESLPGEESKGFYADFRKICPLAATYFQDLQREWRFGPEALNDFYNHLLWFFTRKRIFFGPVACPNCQAPVDLGIVFEGQAIEVEDEEPGTVG